MGAEKRRQGGSARALSRERFSPKAKPGGRPEAFRLEAELSERPLRGGLPVLHWCPFARFLLPRAPKKRLICEGYGSVLMGAFRRAAAE